MTKNRLGVNQRRILLILLGSISLGLSRNPRQYFYNWRRIKWEWQKLSKGKYNYRKGEQVSRSLRRLKNLGFVKEKINKNGTVSFYLSKEGIEKAIIVSLEKIKIKHPKKWDKKWRIVIFDIPENIKKKREVIRYLLKRIGFRELQKSVFAYPFDCKKEIEYVVKSFELEKHVNFILADEIEDDKKIKKEFKV